MNATAERIWSAQQIAIFNWFENPAVSINGVPEHLVAIARAGTGKTTTIVEGVLRAPEKNIVVCAFNVKIAAELQTRVASNPNVTAKTIHSLGFAAVSMYRKNLIVDVKLPYAKKRAHTLSVAVCGATAPDTILSLVSKLHTLGREIKPHATTFGELTELQQSFECEPDEQWIAAGFDAAYVERKALAAMELASQVQSGGVIDYSDMIFLPVRNGWLHKTYDLVVGDEAQDWTVAQLEILQGICRGRMCLVGDDRQAIYGFRGADSDSLNRLRVELDARVLGLNTTYRCGRNIVAEAQNFVPDFECGAQHDGSIETLAAEKLVETATAGDFILSRVNAPLVSVAMKLLRNGKRTRIAGREIGKGLINQVKKFNAKSIPQLLSKIAAWENKEVVRMRSAKREDRIETIHDQAEMMVNLTDGANNVNEVIERLESLFTDNGLGDKGMITCSSVHRSKGLEADRVFILASTLRRDSIEEENICYVAITRAKHTLVYVN
jgi:superfamily I DNA/RNA helicase